MTPPTVRPAAVLFSALVLAMAGCGGNDSTLTGQVTYQGQPVIFGAVIVHCADGIGRSSSIGPDGKYAVGNLPTGPVKITVESPELPDPAARRPRPPRSEGPAETPPEYKPLDRSKWVRLPDKFADPDKSGLTTTLKRGTNRLDIPLQ
jgi:hypothetical protein